jgi:uncharacterized protein (DUF2336 family)
MSAADTLAIPALEEALSKIPVLQSAEAVRRITDLFLAGASQFNDDHVHVFDGVLGRLMGLLQGEPLVQLARRLAPVRNAPREVIRRLARDPGIAVAGPVLARSSRLSDADIAQIAGTHSQAHRFAISGRLVLSETVADVLVDCGDRDVVRNLAMNHGAKFSTGGMAMLNARAINDAVLAEKLGQRRDVPAAALRGLLMVGSAEVRHRLLAAVTPEVKAEIETAAESADNDAHATADHVEAWRTVRALQHAGHLDEAHIRAFVESGRMMEATAAMATISGTSVDMVRRLTRGAQPDATLILCQAAGLSRATADAITGAAGGDAEPLEATLGELGRLTPATAAQIVGFWRSYHAELCAAG